MMSHYRRWFILFWVHFYISMQEIAEGSVCKKIQVTQPGVLVAHAGWPFELSCGLFAEINELYYSYDASGDDYGSSEGSFDFDTVGYVCQIFHKNGSILLNTTGDVFEILERSLVLPDLQAEDLLAYNMILQRPQTDDCWKIDAKLNVTNPPETSCKKYSASYTKKLSRRRVTIGNFRQIQCKVFDDEFPQLARDQHYTYKWQHNCSDTLPTGTVVTETGAIFVKEIGFQHGGMYTCSVTYKGMTRFAYFTTMCVHHKLSVAQHTFTCPSEIIVNNKKEAAINCVGDFGTGEPKDNNIKFTWNRENGNETLCKTEYDIRSEKEGLKENRVGPKQECIYKVEEKCYLYDPPQSEKERSSAIIRVRLVIKNFTESDYGKYIMVAHTNVQETDSFPQTVVLKRHHILILLSSATKIAIGVAIVFTVLLMSVLIICKLEYFKALHKIYFAEYDIDNKEYGACLIYNFSQNIDKFTREDVSASVKRITSLLEEMGHEVYDKSRDGFLESVEIVMSIHKAYLLGDVAKLKQKFAEAFIENFSGIAENIQATVAKSHRAVIILTSDFIKDEWSMFSLYKGFDKMIKSDLKLIFILLPGIKNHIKQRQCSNDACRIIQSAMKLNYAIEMPVKNYNKNSIKFQLQAAMPKLRPKKSRVMSNASSGYASMTFYNKNGNYERQVSSSSSNVSSTEFQDSRC